MADRPEQTRRETRFAPAERTPEPLVERRSQLLERLGLPRRLLDGVNEFVLVLDENRQIVFVNARLVEMLGVESRRELLGLRPGEALGCPHAREEAGGCGTSEFCGTCGAVQAILEASRGCSDARECRILVGREGDALDLVVRATPLEVAGERLTVFAATDISHEKRRRVLERVFFHDLLNTAAGVKLLCAALDRAGSGSRSGLLEGLRACVEQLVEEIVTQRDLMAAESCELSVRPEDLSAWRLAADLLDTGRGQIGPGGCRLRLDPGSEDVAFRSDPALLSRVLANMVRNAVEACRDGQTVTLGCGPEPDGEGVRFWVHNPGSMPREVQLQVFQRSFSTKGAGRGLGTYSMKLLTERYLDGRVEFESSPEAGTTFRVRYPLSIGPRGEE